MSVHVPLGPLLDPAFHLGSVPTTWAELLGFTTGAVNVWLVVRQNILNWPIGIANVILLGLVFLDGGLYAVLYVIFLTLCVFGLLAWRRDLLARTPAPEPAAA
ncbi:nicotinamide mononucleotide transporter family protein [Actinomadura latina]|uniref:Nicotinamide mononucleotide transporter n=1 Tax=Actinomadura latina TaxID=163603 RepID=A0A846Z160_9ACTN|nr:nicotinamide mononucleotide transporter family protein [Actinomadura latina]NKZ04448.1 nicotinamide mononucleotide transporter [Actinomadura latina]